VSGGESVVILLVAVIGLSRQSHDFDENKQLDHESTINFPLIDRLFHSYFIKAIDYYFYGFTGAINHLGCWENTRKARKLDHSPNGS